MASRGLVLHNGLCILESLNLSVTGNPGTKKRSPAQTRTVLHGRALLAPSSTPPPALSSCWWVTGAQPQPCAALWQQAACVNRKGDGYIGQRVWLAHVICFSAMPILTARLGGTVEV